jgi:hypothetical protein
MREVQAIARLKIHPGKLAEFERLAAACMESARTKDTGTLQYEQYFNSDPQHSLELTQVCSSELTHREVRDRERDCGCR